MSQTRVKVDYIQKSEREYIQRSDNFLAKIDSYIKPLGFIDTDFEAIKSILPQFKEAYLKKKMKHSEAKAATIYCDNLEKACTKVIRKTRQMIISSPHCSPAILDDLGLYNRPKFLEMDIQAPVLRVKLVAGVPQVKYKRKPFDAIRLCCSINNGDSYYEETVIQSYFNDTKVRVNPHLPEVREYHAYYIKKGELVGQCSNKVKIILDVID